MSALSTYFTDFLALIRPQASEVSELMKAHNELRERLRQDERVGPRFVASFLQGSYRRSTLVRPKDGEKADVDVVVVTDLDRGVVTPHQALQFFMPFLEKHYKGQWRYQGRSIGIGLDTIELDLVVTSAPSEVNQTALRSASILTAATLEEAPEIRFNKYWLPLEQRSHVDASKALRLAAEAPEWKLEPLWIPDREAREWQMTHPLAQLQWTRDKNKRTSGHFVNVVKALKWWRRVKHPKPEDPRSFPLERIIAECCPDGIGSVAEGVVRVLEGVGPRFAEAVERGETPQLLDYGIAQDVLKRITSSDFAEFFDQAVAAAAVARQALDEPGVAPSALLWQQLLGDEDFPSPPSSEGSDTDGNDKQGGSSGGFSPRRERTIPGSGRFA